MLVQRPPRRGREYCRCEESLQHRGVYVHQCIIIFVVIRFRFHLVYLAGRRLVKIVQSEKQAEEQEESGQSIEVTGEITVQSGAIFSRDDGGEASDCIAVEVFNLRARSEANGVATVFNHRP
tara:strand:+ start:110 stop:475 length:366 start_codon:yes stop_codon:yes gene_type:complete